MNQQPLLIKNARIIKKDSTIDEKTILINQGVIQQIVDELHQLNSSFHQQKMKVIDANHSFLSPGLIDYHVHLILNGAKDTITYVNTTSPEEFKQIALKNMHNALQNGITTLRDMGDTAGILGSIKSEKSSAKSDVPHLFSSGEMLTTKKGHVKSIPRKITSQPEVIDKAIDKQIMHHADCIKLIISGGMLSPNSTPLHTELDKKLIKQVCTKATQKNLPIAAHVYSDEDIKNAIKAGVKSIEHGLWATKQTLQKAVQENIVFTPTLKAAYDIIEHKDLLPNYMIKNAELVLSQAPSFIKNAKECQVDLAMGTDAGTPFNFHGDNAKELEYLTELGLTNIEAIHTATTTPSQLLKYKILTGQIKKGYSADLILLSKNPLDDITAFQNNIDCVIFKGICIKSLKN